jgi:hypothetical protein
VTTYKTETVRKAEDIAEALNKAEADGWELAFAAHKHSNNTYVLILKRESAEGTQQGVDLS